MNKEKKSIYLMVVCLLFIIMSVGCNKKINTETENETEFEKEETTEITTERKEKMRENEKNFEIEFYDEISYTEYKPTLEDKGRENVVIFQYAAGGMGKGLLIDYYRNKVLMSYGVIDYYFDDYVVCDLDDKLKEKIYELMDKYMIYTLWDTPIDPLDSEADSWDFTIQFMDGEVANLYGGTGISETGPKELEDFIEELYKEIKKRPLPKEHMYQRIFFGDEFYEY